MKKIFIFSLLAAILLSTAAMASDGSYSTVVDSFTGEPVDSASDAAPDAGHVTLSESSWYDLDNHAFVYQLSSGGLVYSSVAKGIATTGSVYLSATQGVEMLLYRDGYKVDVANGAEISEVGAYVLNVANGGNDEQVLTFTILNSVTGVMNTLLMPENFVVDEVYLNDELQDYEAFSVDLSEEGTYRIIYLCRPTRIRYNLDIRVDHTPPVLALENVVDGVAKGPVDLTDLEPGVSISIVHDGETMAYTEQLQESGAYRITLWDAAGNSTVYNFAIQVYFNVSSIVFFLLIVGVLLIAMIYMIRSRRKLRVR